jgi:glycosyltransferase involved in cell wall biosynthesis
VKKRLLIITQHFWPEQFTINQVVNILKVKYKVDVFTGKPNYPTGNFFKGYSFFSKNFEKNNGIDIYRCPVLPRKNATNLNLLINYLSFVFFSSIWLFIFFFKHYDYIFIYQTTPVTSSISGIILSKIKKIPLILWIQDLWPDTVKATGHVQNKFIYKIISIISNRIYKSSDIIATQSEGIKKIVEKRFKNKKIFYLPNVVNENKKNDRFKKLQIKKKLEKKINILFTGNTGVAQNLEFILKVAKNISNNNKFKKIRFLIVGGGSRLNKLKKINNDLRLSNVVFYGHIKSNEMQKYFSLGDYFILTIKKKNIFLNTIPNKFINYLYMAKPIIGCTNGDVSKIINNYRCGFCCKPDSVNDFKKILNKILNIKKKEYNDMSINSKKSYNDNFTHKIFLNKFNNIINKYENNIIN